VAECLPRICDSMCGNEQYVTEYDRDQRSLQIVSRYTIYQRKAGRIAVEPEMFRVGQNQLNV